MRRYSSATYRKTCIVVMVLFLGGCGSVTHPAATPHASPRTSIASMSIGAPAPLPTSGAPAQLHGIVVETCTPDAVTLTAYEPMTGTPSQVSLSFSLVGTRVCTYSATVTPMERPRRNQFSADYSKIAAEIDAPDGGKHIGFIPAGGAFVDLTPARGSNYGAKTRSQTFPVFNPVSGRLWYYEDAAKTHFGSVDPDAGPSSAHAEPDQGAGAFQDGFDFAANGKTVVDKSSGVVTPDGKWYLLLDPADGWHVGSTSATTGTGTLVPLDKTAPAPGCWAKNFIDQHRFLCVGNGTQDSPLGIYVMTLSNDRTHLTQTALLPASENAPIDELADPSGRQIAFIAAGALYVTSASALQEPRNLVGLDGDVRLVDWG